MIPINFNTTHLGFFKNTTNWQQLCRNIKMESYIADIKENPQYFFLQRFVIQNIMLEGMEFKANKFKTKPIVEMINSNISFFLIDHYCTNEIDIFKFNIIRNVMLTIIKNKHSIIEILQNDANSYALNKQFIIDIPIKENQNKLVKI